LASEPRGGGARRRGTPRLQGKRPHQHGRDRTTLRRGGDGSLPGGPHSPSTAHYWGTTEPREEGATCQSLTPTTSMSGSSLSSPTWASRTREWTPSRSGSTTSTAR